MKNILGRNIKLTLFGESHGPAVGAVLDGIPAGVRIDYDLMAAMMNARKAAGAISTGRQEDDIPEILSGVRNGYTEGTPIAFLIRNQNVRRQDYSELQDRPRPGHADYTGHIKYLGYEDASGGGHFSARLTAPIVAAGAVVMGMLKEKGIRIGTHIASLHGIEDRPFNEDDPESDINLVCSRVFPVLDDEAAERMKQAIAQAREEKDSLGGILDTAITGLEAGIGEPEFDSLESMIAHAVFSVPAVKGIEFGAGFRFAEMKGSEANDPFILKDGKVMTSTNNNGGINGGISNGMPVRFRTVIKPTPSIGQVQKTVDLQKMEETQICITGRHDPAVIHRGRVVIDAVTAFAVADLLMDRHGALWFAGEPV